jgi:hypothetical protein
MLQYNGSALSSKLGGIMRLSAPTQVVFLISLVLFALALIGHFAHVQYLTQYQFGLAIAAYVVLAAGNLFKGV